MKRFRVLLWKEWRQGWVVGVLGCGAAFGGCLLAQRLADVPQQAAYGTLFLSLAAALVAARAFASEGEAGTARFLMHQPVRTAAIWSAKLLMGALFLAALYGAWFWLRSGEFLWWLWAEWAEPQPGYMDIAPMMAFVPLFAFCAAFLLSGLLDNTVLAFVGGCTLSMVYTLWVRLLLALGAYDLGGAPRWFVYETPYGRPDRYPVYSDASMAGWAAAALLAPAVLLLALSYLALRLRKGR